MFEHLKNVVANYLMTVLILFYFPLSTRNVLLAVNTATLVEERGGGRAGGVAHSQEVFRASKRILEAFS